MAGRFHSRGIYVLAALLLTGCLSQAPTVNTGPPAQCLEDAGTLQTPYSGEELAEMSAERSDADLTPAQLEDASRQLAGVLVTWDGQRLSLGESPGIDETRFDANARQPNRLFFMRDVHAFHHSLHEYHIAAFDVLEDGSLKLTFHYSSGEDVPNPVVREKAFSTARAFMDGASAYANADWTLKPKTIWASDHPGCLKVFGKDEATALGALDSRVRWVSMWYSLESREIIREDFREWSDAWPL